MADDLRHRYAEALARAERAEAEIIALTDHGLRWRERAETAEAKVREYENAISWGTDCIAHATLHDKLRRQEERAEKAEAAQARVRRLAEEWTELAERGDPCAESIDLAIADCARDVLATLDDTTAQTGHDGEHG